MGHRPLSNSMEMSEIDQDLYQSRGTDEQSYIHMGRGATPENGSVVYPMENTLSGVYCSPYQNMEYRPVQHSLLSARMEGPQFRVAGSGASYDPFLHSTAPGSSYMVPENSAGHAHMNYYNSHTTQEVESALLDPTMGTGRNPFKRKSPDLSLGCETGSTSRFYATGSSSSSSESQPEKSTSDYRHFSSSSIGLPHYRGGIKFEVGVGDRIRFWFDEWCSERPLNAVSPVVFSLVGNQQVAVSEVLCHVNGAVHWNVIFTRNAQDWELDEIAGLLYFVKIGANGRDCFLWKHLGSNKFSVKVIL